MGAECLGRNTLSIQAEECVDAEGCAKATYEGSGVLDLSGKDSTVLFVNRFRKLQTGLD